MFNHQARWDRKLPGDEAGQWEPVEVIVRFMRGRIFPLYFFVKSSQLRVERIHYAWTERKGKGMLYYFNVSDASDQYRLCLDTETMSWHLAAA
ncbi:MAG: hypothetical protein PHT59_00485 [Candidatus Omnitrophica bacterium]|nr:hypothetical protein [Candidatus Omnitrophota bacterium]